MCHLVRRCCRFARVIKALATYDFLPDFSAKARRAVATPLGFLLVAALVAALCGLVLHPRVFALAAGLLVVTALGIAWPGLTLRGVKGRVAFERERVSEGEAVGATVTAVNHLPWPAMGVALRGGYSSDKTAIAARLARLAARAESMSRWEFTPHRRGDYPLAIPHLVCGFPFGLWEARRAVAVQGRLIVWPRTLPVGPVPLTDGDAMVEGNVARNKVGQTGDVLGVRPYRRGDSPRRIHWPQSVRHDNLIVCELQSTARPVVQIVLDGNSAAHVLGPDGTWEWAIRIAASFARGWLEAGAQVGLVAHDVVVVASSGRGQVRRILDALARLPETGGASIRELLARPICRAFCAGVQILITTDSGSANARHGRNERQLWVVLRGSGFGGEEQLARNQPVRPWLTIDSPADVPHRLRLGWSEARHGS